MDATTPALTFETFLVMILSKRATTFGTFPERGEQPLHHHLSGSIVLAQLTGDDILIVTCLLARM